jgi:alcohol dehydrogenase (NADP+)
VLLHAPFCWPGSCDDRYPWQEAWRELEQLVIEGHVNFAGVSQWSVTLLEELESFATIPVSLVQNWMDPFNQDFAVREWCAARDVGYMAFSTLGTQWTMQRGSNPVFSSPILRRIAAKHNCSIAEVVLSWALQEGSIIIPRSTRPAHIHANVRLLNCAESEVRVFLDQQDWQHIRALDGSINHESHEL